MTKYRINLGYRGENISIRYLRKQSYGIIARHWQKQVGELDIIAFDNISREVVFIEVKTRKSSSYGSIEQSIGYGKRKKLRQIIDNFIVQYNFRREYRFDVIFVKIGDNITLKHITNISLE